MAAFEIRRIAQGPNGDQTTVLCSGKSRRLGRVAEKLAAHPGAYDRYLNPPEGVNYSYELWVRKLGHWTKFDTRSANRLPPTLVVYPAS